MVELENLLTLAESHNSKDVKTSLLITIIAEKRIKILKDKKKIEHDDKIMKQREEYEAKALAIGLENKRKNVINRDNLYVVILIATILQAFVIALIIAANNG